MHKYVNQIVIMQDSSQWVPYIAAALIIVFILFFCGGPSMCITHCIMVHTEEILFMQT